MESAELTSWVVNCAQGLGFDLCGVAPARAFEELSALPDWLARGYSGEMAYLHDPRRADPAHVLDGARSIIVCALNYNTRFPYSTEVPAAHSGDDARSRGFGTKIEDQSDSRTRHSSLATRHSPRGWISRYAWGDDYHEILLQSLNELIRAMRQHVSAPFDARPYVDTGPIVERVAARHAGLGWLAKNTCLINERLGSWLFLGVIVTSLELALSLDPAEPPPPDLCGNCRLCLDACPTNAILDAALLDARRCISYLTIELRGSIPEEFRSAIGRHVFGCDICQDVCPYNRDAPISRMGSFAPRWLGQKGESLFAPELEFLAGLDEPEFQRVFTNSAVKRTKWRGLVRNACVALGNSQLAPDGPATGRILALLERLAASDDALIAEHARWAFDRLRAPES